MVKCQDELHPAKMVTYDETNLPDSFDIIGARKCQRLFAKFEIVINNAKRYGERCAQRD